MAKADRTNVNQSAHAAEPSTLFRASRRSALEIGAGLFGLNLATWSQAHAAGANDVASANSANNGASKSGSASKNDGASKGSKDVSCIFIFLAGGPSHYETFDPKPDAPREVRGLWQPTATNVPGTFICEKLPLLAQRMDKVAIIRSWQGKNGGHDIGSQHVTSGFLPERGKQFFPNFGCLLSALRGNRVPGMPAHFGVPVDARYTHPPGYLGAAYDSFNIKGDPRSPELQFNKLSVPAERFGDRQSLLVQLDNLKRLTEAGSRTFEAHDKFGEEAIALLTSGSMARALNLDEERPELRERYGMNMYGQRVLMARRLIEAGARFVTINQAVQGGLFGAGTTNGTWDNHHLLFDSMMSFANTPANLPKGYNWQTSPGPGNLPQLDMSLSALLDDLEERGMLDSTLVVVMGEFGRTPRINKDGGRDHYPNAGNLLMAGAGVKRGAVIGATDRTGALPATRPWTPGDVAASVYHALGIDAHRTHFPRLPRPTPIADGQVIDGLFG